MNTMLQPLSATAFDAVSAAVSAACFLIVGFAVILRAPRDPRARVFLLIAVASVAPYSMSVLIWAGQNAPMGAPGIAVGLSLVIGSLALFHFTQVFPRRRPWIRTQWPWLRAAYIVVPLCGAILAVVLTRFLQSAMAAASSDGSGALGAATPDMVTALAILVIGVPALFLVGIILPFAGLMSLYKSWQEAKRAGLSGERLTTFWILISQVAGGVLTILVIPVLHLAEPRGPWVTIAAALLFGFGLLMPIVFAIGTWKFRVLDIDSESQLDERRLPG